MGLSREETANLQDIVSHVILSAKFYINMRPIRGGYGVMDTQSHIVHT